LSYARSELSLKATSELSLKGSIVEPTKTTDMAAIDDELKELLNYVPEESIQTKIMNLTVEIDIALQKLKIE